MKSLDDLDQLLVTMDVAVSSFVLCEIGAGGRPAAPVSAIMLYYVVSGTMQLEIGDRDERLCGPGSVALIPPGMNARFRDAGRAGTLRVAVAVVVARLSGSFGLLDRAKVPVVEDMSGSRIVGSAFAMILDDLAAAAPPLGTKALVNALMKSCILAVLRRFFRRPGIDQKIVSALADPRLAGAVAMILDRPGAAHSVATLAAKAGLSRSTFARLFADAMQRTPMEFVARTRLHHAAELLRASRMPIKAIAADIGFSSRSHFSRAFRDVYGKDPSRYRAETGDGGGPGGLENVLHRPEDVR